MAGRKVGSKNSYKSERRQTAAQKSAQQQRQRETKAREKERKKNKKAREDEAERKKNQSRFFKSLNAQSNTEAGVADTATVPTVESTYLERLLLQEFQIQQLQMEE